MRIVRPMSFFAWQWVCAAHLPLQARPLFPYDPPQARDLAELSQCPNCDVTYEFGLATSALLGGQPVHHCTECGWVWVLLHARGYSDDGAVLVQQVLDLADRLHGFAISTRAEVPPPALRAVCRATGLSIEEGDVSICGIPFMEQRRFICNDSVVLCQVTAEALRELQAGPVIAKTSSSEPIKGHQKGIKHTRPRPGDIWFHKDSFEPVLIKWTSSDCVKLGDDSSLDLALFSSTYIHYPVTFAVGSELIKKSASYTGAECYTILKICQFSSTVTVASQSGGQQELTWSQVLTRYRLLKRRTVNERLKAADNPFLDDVD